MKLCTSTNIMNFHLGKPYSVSMEDAVRACAAAGYKYIDANLCGFSRPGQALALEDWEQWVEDTLMLARELGVEFIQAHAYWTIGNPFKEDLTRVDGEWGEELMRRSVIAAERLGAKWMVVHPYTVWQDTWYDYKKSFTYNREYFKRWGEIYADHHVGMAIENMAKNSEKVSYCARGEELLELVEAIDNPMVQICIDTGHAHLSGIDPSRMIRLAGAHLKATHIADNHRNKDEHFAPLNGTIDWSRTMGALKEIGYEEAFAFEIHHLTSMYPAQIQQDLINFSFALGNYLLNL
ncbi:MAG: sugar phosphate isomerase/epimerase [Hungatella sp.]|nr:sugar phosphate isomerase/epimerase [Hungatella sp.]